MIRRFAQYLFGWPCDHEWETLRDGAVVSYVYYNHLSGKTSPEASQRVWLYRCKKCSREKEIRS